MQEGGLTITEFLSEVGKDDNLRQLYCTPKHVAKLCKQGGFSAKFPEWRAEKRGRNWLIFKILEGPEVQSPPMSPPMLRAFGFETWDEDQRLDNQVIADVKDLETAYFNSGDEMDWREYWQGKIDEHVRILGHLWAKQIEKISIDLAQEERFSTLEEVLSGDTTNPTTMESVPPLANSKDLLDKIAFCFQYAVLRQAEVDLAVTFRPDGTWRLHLNMPLEPNPCDFVEGRTQRRLIDQCIKVLKSEPLPARCVKCEFCGKRLRGRSDKRYCSGGECEYRANSIREISDQSVEKKASRIIDLLRERNDK